jgi:hypothetical protein
MNTITVEYKEKVWRFLEAMKPDEPIIIAQKVKPETREDFITAVKEYMDKEPWQGWLSFNKDYSKLYKIHAITFKDGTKNL